MSQKQSERRGRSAAEWITLGVSVLIITSLVGLLTYLHFTRGTDPPVIEVEPQLGEVRQEGEFYYLPLAITNSGDDTAQDVEVDLSLDTGEGEPETAGFSIRFLAGGETEHETVVFRSDPAEGELTHTVAYSVP